MGKRLGDVDGFDPHVSTGLGSQEIIANVYETLVRWDAQTKVFEPGLVSGVPERPAPGGTWTFNLRPDARFESGARVTPDDVVFSLKRSFQVSPMRSPFLQTLGFTDENIDACIRVAGDAVSIVVPVGGAAHLLLPCLSATACSVVERRALTRPNVRTATPGVDDRTSAAGGNAAETTREPHDDGRSWLAFNSAGSGPFRLRNAERTEVIALGVNARHPDAERLRPLLIRDMPDAGSQLARLRGARGSRDGIDIARDVPPEALGGQPGYASGARRKANLLLLAMNVRRTALASEGVRNGIRAAIDLDAIEAGMAAFHWRRQTSFCPSVICEFGLPHAFDPAAAEAALANAVRNPLELLHVEGTPRSLPAELIADQLARVGVATTMRPATGLDVMNRLETHDFDLALVTWGSDYPHPHGNALAFCSNPPTDPRGRASATLAASCGWSDVDTTAALATALLADDGDVEPAGRRKFWKARYSDVAKALNARGPFVFMMEGSGLFASRPHAGEVSLGALDCLTRYRTERT